MKESKQTNVKVRVLSHREFGNVKVVNDGEYNGYACLDDLCAILNLSKKQVKEKLDGHLYTVSPKDPKETFHDMDFVDEFGIYVMYIMSKEKNTIRVQEWFTESNLQLEVLRNMATATNVIKSGHFKTGKAIPELTHSHLIGWWHNHNDQSIFMLQFNCQSDCCLYGNIRMNIYLRKMVDGRIDFCDMHITFLDLAICISPSSILMMTIMSSWLLIPSCPVVLYQMAQSSTISWKTNSSMRILWIKRALTS